jgi:hypothetical protein
MRKTQSLISASILFQANRALPRMSFEDATKLKGDLSVDRSQRGIPIGRCFVARSDGRFF